MTGIEGKEKCFKEGRVRALTDSMDGAKIRRKQAFPMMMTATTRDRLLGGQLAGVESRCLVQNMSEKVNFTVSYSLPPLPFPLKCLADEGVFLE